MARSNDALLVFKMMTFVRNTMNESMERMRSYTKGKGNPFQRGGVMMREYLLTEIGLHKDGIRQKDLAEIAGNKASAISELVKKLEADGYVVREPDPADKRATLVKLTDAGRERAMGIADAWDEVFLDVFSCLSDEERLQLEAILDKLVEHNKEQQAGTD